MPMRIDKDGLLIGDSPQDLQVGAVISVNDQIIGRILNIISPDTVVMVQINSDPGLVVPAPISTMHVENMSLTQALDSNPPTLRMSGGVVSMQVHFKPSEPVVEEPLYRPKSRFKMALGRS